MARSSLVPSRATRPSVCSMPRRPASDGATLPSANSARVPMAGPRCPGKAREEDGAGQRAPRDRAQAGQVVGAPPRRKDGEAAVRTAQQLVGHCGDVAGQSRIVREGQGRAAEAGARRG
ncbi:hypothetical protein MCOR02_012402 [Pyricularia oryzae]|nr:hypothetical protein MCOR02_012402 [Pyricularia oryzae]